jgi:hypothetical protein
VEATILVASERNIPAAFEKKNHPSHNANRRQDAVRSAGLGGVPLQGME